MPKLVTKYQALNAFECGLATRMMYWGGTNRGKGGQKYAGDGKVESLSSQEIVKLAVLPDTDEVWELK